MGSDFGSIVLNPVAYGTFFERLSANPWVLFLRRLFSLSRVSVSFQACELMQITAVGLMGGLGFTMSILISGLAFSDQNNVLAAKCAILAGSIAASLWE